MGNFYTESEVQAIGFAKVGKNVLISKKTSIYGANNISLGNNIRIDDFCVLSGKINFGDYVHIAVFSAIFGGVEGVIFEDYSCLSSRCAVYAKTDDFSGDYLTNPTVPDEYKNVIDSKVIIGKYVTVGTGSTVLPGVTIGEGCAFGAMTLIRKSTEPWGIYVGEKCLRIKERSKKLLEY